jgi:hypothetical protein
MNYFLKVIDAVAGYKTYIAAAIAAVDASGAAFGVWHGSALRGTYELLAVLLFMRMGMKDN